ncbi:melanocyte-stimulating hormone receptor-like [Oculina patagonica]
MANTSLRDNNFTNELNQTSTSTWPTSLLLFLVVLNVFLSITATLGNALILVALHKETSLYPPMKLLFRCLAVTDLCVGLISHPLNITSLMSSIVTGINWKIIYYVGKLDYASSFILCGVSVYTSTAISVDRLLALLLGLRYRHIITLRRVRALIVCFWLMGILCASIYFWNRSTAFSVYFAFTLLSLVTLIFAYTKIYLKLRHYQFQVHGPKRQPNKGGIPLNIARYKKSVSSVLWVQLTLVACYAPFLIFAILHTYGQMMFGNELEITFYFTGTLVYLNSSLNPILYCWKIKTVRQAAKDKIRQLICCKSI